jgi:hypothetical protein
MRISNHFLPVLLVHLTTGCTLIADVDRNDIRVPALEGGGPEDDGGGGTGGGGGDAGVDASDAAVDAPGEATPDEGGAIEAGPDVTVTPEGGDQMDAAPLDAAEDAPADAPADE